MRATLLLLTLISGGTYAAGFGCTDQPDQRARLACYDQLAEAIAQCPMCKAAVESSNGGDSSLAEGINNGIIYILSLPYIMIMVVGILWYRKWRKKKAAEQALESQPQ